MSETTNLHLFERDPATEGGAFFSVKEMLNNNWEKIDDFAGDMESRVTTAENTLLLPGVLLYNGTYTGAGGNVNKTISTTKKPFIVFIFGDSAIGTEGTEGLICVRPSTEAARSWQDGAGIGTDAAYYNVTWSNTGLSISRKNGTKHPDAMNESGKTYHWIALCTG